MKKTTLCIAMVLLVAPLYAMNDDNDDIEMSLPMYSARSTTESSESNATHPGESYSVNIGERDSDPVLLPRDEHVPRHRHHHYPNRDFFKAVSDSHEKIAHRLAGVNENLCWGRFSLGLTQSLGAAAIVAMLCGAGSSISDAIANASDNFVNAVHNIHPQCSCSCPACPTFPPAPAPMTMAYNDTTNSSSTSNSTLSMNATQFMAMAAKMKKEKID